MKRRILLAAMPLATLGRTRAEAQGQQNLKAEQGWSRPALARIGTAVAYLTLRNEGGAPVRVIGASTPAAEGVEIHESVVENDVARMRPRPDGVAVPSGGTVRFEPGGLHLMLMKPYADLKAGQSFTLTLRLDSGEVLAVPVTVAMREPTAGHSGMNH
ncbi:copper chaperone PCu(A)C [Roseomonas sp. E05]|uniref:copper chaperone PCu(A)C n=1 Tax=Roseomonas sp. E05 TaxID=3046310 RepID=UPI0024B92287|nr:copper chaperone PCu(A)C [Roseomonas sp. E05]MDJ0391544.1 copper chaperone PCu(A)C [Roseomonas sp. E05]